MMKRYIVMIAGLLSVVAGLGAVKYGQISMLMARARAAASAGPPPVAVSTSVARAETWGMSLSAVGSIAAAKGVTLSNDAPGVVTHIYFESGEQVRKGQILVELDRQVERAELSSAKARKELAAANVGRSRALTASGVVSTSQLDNDEAMLKTAGADIDTLDAQIARKIVRAPFSGRLGIRQVNLGQYLNSGTPIAVLESSDAVFVDFTLPQQRLDDISLGTPVRAMVAGAGSAPYDGTISAIDPTVDSATRSIRVRASLSNEQKKLLPGMFAKVEVLLAGQQPVVAVPATAILHASYGDSVFIVEDKTGDKAGEVTSAAVSSAKPVRVARQQFVRTGQVRGDFIAIVDGVKAGQELVTAGAFKLRNGARVIVHNETQPTPELSPHPENR